MKKEDLKVGMLVVFRNKERAIVTEGKQGNLYFSQYNAVTNLENFDNDLKEIEWKTVGDVMFVFDRMTWPVVKNLLKIEDGQRKMLWHRVYEDNPELKALDKEERRNIILNKLFKEKE